MKSARVMESVLQEIKKALQVILENYKWLKEKLSTISLAKKKKNGCTICRRKECYISFSTKWGKYNILLSNICHHSNANIEWNYFWTKLYY